MARESVLPVLSRIVAIRSIVVGLVINVAFAVPLLGGQTLHSSSGLEFPVVLRGGVESGRTPVGTKVQATLTVATLVHGVVVPEGAKLYGEVTESSVGSASGSDLVTSRLAIRMDSADWKIGSKRVTISFESKVYLTTWYYPLVSPLDRTATDDAPAIIRNPQQRRNGNSGYPTTTPRSTPPFPTPTTDSDPDPVPPAPKSNTSQHRELMKDVELVHNSDGSVALTSTQAKIKLNKSTTYVMSSADLLPTK